MFANKHFTEKLIGPILLLAIILIGIETTYHIIIFLGK